MYTRKKETLIWVITTPVQSNPWVLEEQQENKYLVNNWTTYIGFEGDINPGPIFLAVCLFTSI